MSWKQDWKKWTQATYGIIEAVGRSATSGPTAPKAYEHALVAAQDWSPSSLGFASVAVQKSMTPGSVNVEVKDVPAISSMVRGATIEMLVIQTAAVTEVLLGDLLTARCVVVVRPNTFSDGLKVLRKESAARGRTRPSNAWAIDAAHELRIVRNVLVHASGIWEQQSIRDFTASLRKSVPPNSGHRLSVSFDNLWAYRRAARTILNMADQL